MSKVVAPDDVHARHGHIGSSSGGNLRDVAVSIARAEIDFTREDGDSFHGGRSQEIHRPDQGATTLRYVSAATVLRVLLRRQTYRQGEASQSSHRT